jgi:hypothetical protein
MPHTLMKQLTEMKLTGMAAALSSQMEQPGTYEALLQGKTGVAGHARITRKGSA